MNEANDDKELGDFLRRHATRHPASPELAARIRTELALTAAATPRPPPTSRWRWPAWAFAGMGFAAGIMITAAVLLSTLSTGNTDRLAAELVTSHVRALMVSHLTDVASSDQHTVKPWFQGKLDYAPPVLDHAASGFPLLGGRLDYLAGRPVAALVYSRNQHTINVFVWPDQAPEGGKELPKTATRQGFNLLAWRSAGMQYWAVSDVNSGELQTLRSFYP